jgi:hypothetical protein
MATIFWISVLVVFLAFVLGPCQILVTGGRRREEYIFSFRIGLWKELVGFEWQRWGDRDGGWMILLGRRALGRARPRKKMPSEARRTDKKKREKSRRLWQKCSVRAGAGRVIPALRWLLSEIHLCNVGFTGTAGSGDPALTGMLYGWACAAEVPLGKRVSLEWTPVFQEPFFEGCFSVRLRLLIWRILLGMLRQSGAFLVKLHRCKRKRKGGDSGD